MVLKTLFCLLVLPLFIATNPSSSTSLVCVLCHVTPRTAALQALLFMDFSRQEYWSGLAFPTPGDLPNPGIEPACLASSASAGGFFTTSATWDRWNSEIAPRCPPLLLSPMHEMG